jgi:dolichol-phosphate mannosyltransferase
MQALSEGAEWIVEMDADLSHDPAHLPQLLEAMESADVAIGSRFVPGGADLDRPWSRKIITRLAGLYVRSLLKLKMRDVSSGYRCFSRKVLEAIDMEDMISTGPSVVLEMIYKVAVKGFEIKEVPILFRDRRQGNTKLDTVTLLETLVMVLRLRKMRKAGRI